MPVTIKNCGLNSADAVQAAIASGAHFLGFISYPSSPRHITPQQVKDWLEDTPKNISRVCVLVNPCNATIESHVEAWSPTHLQLHGDETPGRATAIRAEFGLPIIKAIPISEKADLEVARRYEEGADFLLFDTKAPAGQVSGGTGRSFDWTVLQGESFSIPTMLSGGLHIDNIEEALRITDAQYIDISSGLESERGVKDPNMIRAFNEKVKAL